METHPQVGNNNNELKYATNDDTTKKLKQSFREILINLLQKVRRNAVTEIKTDTTENCDSKVENECKKSGNNNEEKCENSESASELRAKKMSADHCEEIEIMFTSNSNLQMSRAFSEHTDTEELEMNGELDYRLEPMAAHATNKIVSVELSSQNSRMRVALGVLIRLILPVVNGVTRRLRGIGAGLNILNILTNFRESRGLLTTMLAYAANTVSMSLSSVQVRHKIHPLLKVMKFKRRVTSSVNIPSPQNLYENAAIPPLLAIEDGPEKCVTCTVLAQPPIGMPIRADVIFIHGLHGSQVNTWKQGLWNSEGGRVNFERPPRPPVRRPKRPRHTRAQVINPMHLSKRRRFDEFQFADGTLNQTIEDCLNNEPSTLWTTENMAMGKKFTYTCDEPDEVEYVDDVEFSFPTFRLRIEDVDEEQILEEKRESPKRKVIKNSKNKKADWSPCWPGDWLPLDCPGVRVIALNYTTDPYLWRPVWVRKRNRTSLTERSREMTQHLIEMGVGVGHPIIWVGHSKGGIFIKQIIVDAWESGRHSSESLWRSSRGVLFYSVPHRGSPLADFNLPLLRQSIELLEIQKNCSSILELHRRFVALYHGGQLKIQVFSFVETALTLMSVLYLRIVGVDSADPGIGEVCGVHLDHREICKPRSRECMLYTELTKMINKVC